jgi:AcrR family transcriptional regulator
VEAQKPQKWPCILLEAAKAFSRFGFKKTSIDEVAKAAGVAKGTVYLGATSKIDLFYQAILRDLRNWNAELAKLIDPRVPADELLPRVAFAAFATLDEFPLARDLITNVYAADLPDFVDRLDELRSEGLSIVLDILRIGVRQGRFREDLDLDAVAGVFLDMMTASIMFQRQGAKTPETEARLLRHASAGLDLVLHGLKPRSAQAADATTDPADAGNGTAAHAEPFPPNPFYVPRS